MGRTPTRRGTTETCVGAETAELVGRVLQGTYQLLHLVGSGGTGAVFEAAHLRIGKRVAVKILSQRARADAQTVERFRREARIAADLGHPHIVDVHDFDETPEGWPYMVMQLLHGEDLETRLERDAVVPLETVTYIVRQICSAVDAAHRHGVIHRDLKPANIFICDHEAHTDFVKVLDFGISKVLGSASVQTQETTILGTPHYMAPEQADPTVANIGPWTDAFAIGSMLYRMLSGQLPFAGESLPGVLYRIVHDEPPPLEQLSPETPGAVREIIAKATRKAPAERYLSLAELGRDLERTVPGPPVDLTGPPAPRRRTTGPLAGAALDDSAGIGSTTEHDRGTGLQPTVSATPLAPGDHPRPASRKWLVLGLVGSLIGVAIVAGVALQRDPDGSETTPLPSRAPKLQPPPTDSTKPGAHPHKPRAAANVSAAQASAVLAPREVTITVSGTPRGARIIDAGAGRLLARVPGSFGWPRSAQPLTLRVVQRGYRTRRLRVLPDADRQLTVRLRKRRVSRDLADNPHL